MYKRGDIVEFESPNDGVGSEQTGTRPYVIVSNNSINEKSNVYIACPLSTKEKGRALPTVTPVLHTPLKKKSFVHVEQIRSIPKKNARNYFGETLNPTDMEELENAITSHLLTPTYRLKFRDALSPKFSRGGIFLLEHHTSNSPITHMPFLIVSNDVGNHHSTIATAIPIVEKSGLGQEYIKKHKLIKGKFSGLNDGILLTEHMKTISTERLTEKVGQLTEGYYEEINKEIRMILGMI